MKHEFNVKFEDSGKYVKFALTRKGKRAAILQGGQQGDLETMFRSISDQMRAVILDARLANDPTAWPWCEACRSYHHPENPTCFKKRRIAQ